MKHSLMFGAGLLFCVFASGQELFLEPSGAEQISAGFLTPRGEIPRHDIHAKVRFDAKNLYVTVFTELDAGKRPNAVGTKDDDLTIFSGDVAEFFLAPEPDSGIYYHFAVNPNGALYTAKQRDISWTPPVSRKIHSTDSSWSAELEIPFAVFGKTPAPGAVWGANFASDHSAPDRYTASWSGSSNYHDARQLGRLIFSSEKDGKNRSRAVNIERMLLRDGILSGTISLPEPLSGTQFRLQTFLDGKEKTNKLNFPERKFSWKERLSDLYQPLKSSHVFELLLTSVPDGRILFRKKALANVVTGPGLHLDRFYYTYGDGNIRYSHNFPEHAQIILRKGGRAVRTLRNVPEQGTLSLAEPRLEPGRYVMEISSGKIRTSRVFFLREKAPAPAPIAPDAALRIADGTFLLDGRPVFLLGASPTGKSFLHFGDAFNIRYGNYGVQENAVEIIGLPGHRLTRKPATGYVFPPDGEHKRIIASYLARKKTGKRAFTRIAYEAQMKVYEKGTDGTLAEKDPPAFYASLYADLKKKAPDQLFSIHIDHHEHLDSFASSCDIFETSYWSSSFASNMMPNLSRDMAEAKKAAGGRPVIFWLGGTIPNASCRTAEELRAGVYLAVLHDISGVIFHMGHGYLPEKRSRLWSLISGIQAEVQEFHSDYRNGKAFPDFVLEASPNLAYAARKTPDGVMLIVVNLSGWENRFSLKTKNGMIDGVLTPYEPLIRHLKF